MPVERRVLIDEAIRVCIHARNVDEKSLDEFEKAVGNSTGEQDCPKVEKRNEHVSDPIEHREEIMWKENEKTEKDRKARHAFRIDE